jgi:ABC-2 type transport system permease protein
MPWAVNQEIKDLNVAVVDGDHSAWSKRLTDKINASGYFRMVSLSASNNDAMSVMEDGDADIIIDIGRNFEKELITAGATRIMISANAVNIMKGGLGAGYMASVVNEFADELRNELFQTAGAGQLPLIEIVPQTRFNAFLDYKMYMVPALMVILLTLLCCFLPALSIVSEKETGTIEQINVTPVKKYAFILGKLIPYWIIGVVVFSFCMVMAYFMYGLYPRGSFLTLYFSAMLYLLAFSGMGLLISNYSATMQQSMFVNFFFLLIFMLISGMFTPIPSMPEWAQTFTWFNPLRYFIEIMRMCYLKGSNITDLTNQIAALAGFAIALNMWAMLSYRKNR